MLLSEHCLISVMFLTKNLRVCLQAGLVKRIKPELQVLNIADQDSLKATLEALA